LTFSWVPVDAKLGMSHASTKETFAIRRLFSIGQKIAKPEKSRTDSQIEPQEKWRYFPPNRE
jgi:hypothetical protein